MNRPIDKPEALARTWDVLNQRCATLLNSRRVCSSELDAVAGDLTWCGEALKLYGGIAVVEFLRALVRVHDAEVERASMLHSFTNMLISAAEDDALPLDERLAVAGVAMALEAAYPPESK